jgi:hypothetical protein
MFKDIFGKKCAIKSVGFWPFSSTEEVCENLTLIDYVQQHQIVLIKLFMILMVAFVLWNLFKFSSNPKQKNEMDKQEDVNCTSENNDEKSISNNHSEVNVYEDLVEYMNKISTD